MARSEFIATFILQYYNGRSMDFVIADALKAADAIYGKIAND